MQGQVTEEAGHLSYSERLERHQQTPQEPHDQQAGAELRLRAGEAEHRPDHQKELTDNDPAVQEEHLE